MLTQTKLDEMVVKAEQKAQKMTEDWYLAFMGPRHPENMPDAMARIPEQQQPMEQDQQGGRNG